MKPADGYPQAARNAFADAYAAECAAVWRCVDARTRAAFAAAGGTPEERARCGADLAEAEAVKDAAIQRCRAARRALAEAEAAYYARAFYTLTR